ncbi:small ribosomal subunit protein eS8-like isoform X4 [Ambystoma mexicanum]|uniref:small ribosomal subunit protein eS8-like isoform X4 n=1 Tax=Ambystoma mexicanum TaxID=8296 RepID=UPI0037E86090
MGGSRDNCKTLRKRQPYHKERKNELGRPAANAKVGQPTLGTCAAGTLQEGKMAATKKVKIEGSSHAFLKAMREVSDLSLGGSEFQDFGASTSKLGPDGFGSAED